MQKIALVMLVLAGFGTGYAGSGIKFVMRSLERHGGMCGTSPCVTLKVSYPEFTPVPNDSRSIQFNTLTQETLLGKYDPAGVVPVLEAVRDTILGQRANETGPDSREPWIIQRDISVIGDTLGLMTFRIDEMRSTGGVHPNSLQLLELVDVRAVKALFLDEMLTAEQKERLRVVAEPYFRKARSLRPTDDLEEAGFTFEGGRFTLTSNVGLVKGGLLLRYNPYEIAPYALGPTDVLVPWADLKKIGLIPAFTRQP
jgi:hypothetical protein